MEEGKAKAGYVEQLSGKNIVLQWDMDMVWVLQDWRNDARPTKRKTRIKNLIDRCISRYKTQDISIVTWFIFLAMIPEFGFPFLWICLANVATAAWFQYMFALKRPIDYDRHLIHFRTDPDTYAFPSLESHMAVVVMLPIILYTHSLLLQITMASLILFIGFTRVYAAIRFPTQIIGSWITGCMGLLIGNHGHMTLKHRVLSRSVHHFSLALVIVLTVAVILFWVENNQSRLLGVPKEEFTRVLTHVMSSQGRSSDGYSIDDTFQTPGERKAAKKLYGRRDSFYYLVNGMRSRAHFNH